MEGIGNVGGNSPQQNSTQLSGSAGIKTSVEQQAAVPATQRVNETPRAEESRNQSNSEEARFQVVADAASQKASFAVSDSRFTIYKEIQNGQAVFVTRFTSLADGTVTTIPEGSLLSSAPINTATLVSTKA